MLHLEGREIGRCKLVRKIGEGGMGEVYLGEQISVGNRPVAVKIVRADEDASDAKIDDIARRFQREAALLGHFNHPNILPVYDSGVQGNLLFLIMQYAPDGSLADAIKGRTDHTLELPAPPSFVADIIGQVADALQYTHDKGVVHRDVKPGNVLLQLEPNGHWHALLADFGIARGADASSHRTQVSGTLAYMAPEQFSGKFSPASDQYALAVMTYQLLTNHTPYEGDLATLTHGHMYGTPPSVRTYNPTLPAAVDGVMSRALAKDPTQRYPSIAEYAKALRAALAQKASRADVAPPPIPAPTGGRVSQGPAPRWPGGKRRRDQGSGPGLGRVWLMLLASIVLLVGIVGAGGYIVQQQQEQQQHAKQTQTARDTAVANAQSTTAAQTAVSQTATAGVTPQTTIVPIPTATSTPTGISQDVTSPPAPPDGVAADPVLSDPSPMCNKKPTTSWTKSNAVSTACADPVGSGVTLTATSTSVLGCINQQKVIQTDGYFTSIVQPISGTVVIAFRQGTGNAQGTLNAGTGYYFVVDRDKGEYQLFATDNDGKASAVPNGGGTLTGALAQHFAMSALYKGSDITLYINGIKLTTVTDGSYNSGWVALCTQGSATFSKVLAYPLAG